MPKRPKPKVHSGDKAERSKTGVRHRKTHLDEQTKILMGGGMLVNVGSRIKGK